MSGIGKKKLFGIPLEDRIVWIAGAAVMLLIAGTIAGLILSGLSGLLLGKNLTMEMREDLESYLFHPGGLLAVAAGYTAWSAKNRFVFETMKPGNRGNSLRLLCGGILCGFVMNALCILGAIVHGDIVFSPAVVDAGAVLFLLVMIPCVLLQGASEEALFRVFLYKRIGVRYPLWIAMAASSLLFGLMHAPNEGFNAMSMIYLTLKALFYVLSLWITGGFFFAAGAHGAWNYTQQFLFGLPNSGRQSLNSFLRAQIGNGTYNPFYDFGFGVEGTVTSIVICLIGCAVLFWIGYKNGRIQELLQPGGELAEHESLS